MHPAPNWDDANSNTDPDSNKTTPTLILDGGLGTSLEDKYKFTFSTSTPLWSSHLLLSQDALPILRKCQSDFALAGADIILTATYQVSIEGFKASGVSSTDDIVTKYLPEALQSAIDAAAVASTKSTTGGGGRQTGRVALSIGPYGAIMVPSTEYSGLYDAAHENVESLTAWHMERFETLFARLEEALLDRVEYIAFETIPRVDEILAVRRVMDQIRDASPSSRLANIPVWISCLFPGDGETLPDGSEVETVLDALLGNTGAAKGIKFVPWGIGINCTKVGKLPRLVRRYEEAVRRLVAAGEVDKWPSLVLYPDGTNGEVYNTETKKWEVPDGASVPEVGHLSRLVERLPPTAADQFLQTPWEIQLTQVVKSTSKTGQWRSILVGGCCKTTDKDIAKLRGAILGCE